MAYCLGPAIARVSHRDGSISSAILVRVSGTECGDHEGYIQVLKKEKKKSSNTECPDPSRIQQLVVEAISAINAVHESMQREVSIVQEERERIDIQYQEVEQNQTRIIEIKNEVDMQRNEIAARTSELESMSQNLQQQESDITTRAKQLEAEESEHASIRDTLATLQGQLNRDKEEIATQREELMERLGSTPKHTSKKSVKSEPVEQADEVEEQEPAPEVLAPKKATPKPASGSDQFRKLRRDAKRKAIGA